MCAAHSVCLSLTHTLTTQHNTHTDLEWKVLYVGSAHDSHKDQVLDEILVGPVPVGLNKFVLQADPPDPAALPAEEVLGVTVVLVTCSYKEREFVRVGYYVNNEYIVDNHDNAAAAEGQQQEEEGDNDTNKPPLVFGPHMDVSKIQRQILADKPRVTKFPIPWGTNTNANTNESADNAGHDENHQDVDMTDRKMAAAGTPSTMGTEDMETTTTM